MPEPIEPKHTPETRTKPTADAVMSESSVHLEQRGERDAMFAGPKAEPRSFPTAAMGIATAAVVILLVVLLLMGRRHGSATGATAPNPTTLQPLAGYAPQLKFSGIELSESTNFAGGKETFVDGHVTNAGSATVTGVTVQVVLAPEGGGPPQLETVPLTLIRTRQPYVDTEPVSAAPLAPGADAEFRLIFDDVRPEWNQQVPEIRVTGVTTR